MRITNMVSGVVPGPLAGNATTLATVGTDLNEWYESAWTNGAKNADGSVTVDF